MNLDIGIDEKDRKEIAEGLSRLLADTYALALKTQNFHWNVTGPLFGILHEMFESQYTELAAAVDEIAERIRALGEPAPGSFARFSTLTSLKEAEGSPDALAMVRELAEGQEAVVRTARALFAATQRGKDEATADLLAERLRAHEKNAWMLRSILE
ncbi:MAG: Dps family protein [Alphaproteobacteria bacterium]